MLGDPTKNSNEFRFLTIRSVPQIAVQSIERCQKEKKIDIDRRSLAEQSISLEHVRVLPPLYCVYSGLGRR